MRHVLPDGIESDCSKAHCRESAFTRADLLAVIGTVMVLGSVLLSSSAATQRKAGLLECKNNLRQVGVAIDQYAKDHTDSLPGPIWSGVFYNYQYSPNYNNGSLAAYLATYLGLHAPDSTNRIAPQLQCPASVDAQPKLTPNPPISVPICFLSNTRITNASGGELTYPFGRPSDPYCAPAKTAQVRYPSEQWSMLDVDQRYLSLYVSVYATYFNYTTAEPVHTARPGGKGPSVYRNTLYFDWSVRPQIKAE
jgi:hypothetical protein